jgi:hypothetical protein
MKYRCITCTYCISYQSMMHGIMLMLRHWFIMQCKNCEFVAIRCRIITTWRPSPVFDYFLILFYQESALQLHESSDDVIIAVATSVHSSSCSILRNFLQETIWQTFVTIFWRKNVLQLRWNLLSNNYNMVSINDTVYSCVSMYYLHILHILSIYNAQYACSCYVIGLSCNISKKYCKILEGKNLAKFSDNNFAQSKNANLLQFVVE